MAPLPRVHPFRGGALVCPPEIREFRTWYLEGVTFWL